MGSIFDDGPPSLPTTSGTTLVADGMPELDSQLTSLTFFVTSGRFQRTNAGTKQMLEEMLSDLGIKSRRFPGWKVHAFGHGLPVGC